MKVYFQIKGPCEAAHSFMYNFHCACNCWLFEPKGKGQNCLDYIVMGFWCFLCLRSLIVCSGKKLGGVGDFNGHAL